MPTILSAALVTTLPEWLALVLAAAVAWRLSRGGAGAAVQELSASNRVLERRIHVLDTQVRDLKIENAELRQRTDFGAVIAKHEERAQDRSDRILQVLDLIAARLGPDGASAELHRRSD